MIRIKGNLLSSLCLAAVLITACAKKEAMPPQPIEPIYVTNKYPLQPSAFVKLPVGSIHATGWLKGQLDLQLNGFTRDVEKVWADLGPNSGWKGGSGESWEAGPYYVRGAVALAYNTGDTSMISQVKPWIEWTLNSQREDGFFGPTSNKDWWPRMLMLQTLETYYEATNDSRVIPFMKKFYTYEIANIEKDPIIGWAKPRGGENLSNIYWLYNRTGDSTLLSLAHVLVKQTTDWTAIFEKDVPIHTRDVIDSTKWLDDSQQHTVNLAHGLKVPTLVYTLNGDERQKKGSLAGVRLIEKYHEQIHGIHTGDERLGGKLPSRGSELCEAVETMHSYEYLLKSLGDPLFGDKIEKAAYNALPSLIDPKWQTHAYYTQPNELYATPGDHAFQQYHGDNLTFSAASGYPCCTVNMHMGWPMLNEHLWLGTNNNGLAAAIYAPNIVHAKVADGVNIVIEEETGYPFKDLITFKLQPEQSVIFPLMLRIPAWCKQPTLTVNGEKVKDVTSGEFVTLQREWKAGDIVSLSLPMEIRVGRWTKNSLGVERGPLAYALQVKENWHRYDWKEKYPTWKSNRIMNDYPYYEITVDSPWNYGLLVDKKNPASSFTVTVSDTIPSQPFDPAQTPVSIQVKAKRIPEWKLNKLNHTDPLPSSPVVSTEKEETVTLLPYGATRLRVSYLPEVKTEK